MFPQCRNCTLKPSLLWNHSGSIKLKEKDIINQHNNLPIYTFDHTLFTKFILRHKRCRLSTYIRIRRKYIPQSASNYWPFCFCQPYISILGNRRWIGTCAIDNRWASIWSPLKFCFRWKQGGKALTIDSMLKILLSAKNTKGDWDKAFEHIPSRKLADPSRSWRVRDCYASLLNRDSAFKLIQCKQLLHNIALWCGEIMWMLVEENIWLIDTIV